MIFNLLNEQGAQKARERLEKLIERKSEAVTITEHKKRTLPQNALFHCWVGIVRNELGYSSFEECKRDIVRELLGQYIHYNVLRKRNEYTDYETSKLSSSQMGELLTLFKAWGAENGILLPSADEKGYYEMLDKFNNENGNDEESY